MEEAFRQGIRGALHHPVDAYRASGRKRDRFGQSRQHDKILIAYRGNAHNLAA